MTFNEITQKAVKAAFAHSRDIDENLVDAQQTRRVLDRLVGYQISPLLWDKVRRGLSAGRVQTVALRLIVEREQEINEFKPVEYWNIEAKLKTAKREEFTAKFVGTDGVAARVANGVDAEGKEQYLSNALPDGKAVEEVLAELERAKWSVRGVEKKERRANPTAPYITSKLQQDASSRLGFNVRRTMGVAQRLYEGVEIGREGTVGLITYMRTDSTRVSPDAIVEAREFIAKLGKQYLPEKANEFAGKRQAQAQDAHEAIRPTRVDFTPDSIRASLSEEQYKLYKLIWQKFVSSQMTAAVFDQTVVDIAAQAADRTYDFRVNGSVLKFDGLLKVWENGSEDTNLPELKAEQALQKIAVTSEQKFTQPPPRFNEASLVKMLEERGIGRPSTYASIINTIQDRDYVKKIQAKFVPTEIGTVVTGLLVKNFPYIFDLLYTARLESELDAVEDGQEKWTDLLNGFYDHFEEELVVAGREMEDIKRMEHATTEICDKCGSPLVLKWGKFGSFYSCSNFSRLKPVTVSTGPWKKDSKAVTKKIVKALQVPHEGEGDEWSCDGVLAGSWRREGDGGGDRAGAGGGQEGDGGAGELRLHQGELRGQAGPERTGSGRCTGGGVLRQLRACDGAEERALGAVYELPRLLGGPAVQDDPQADAEGAAEAAGGAGGGMSEVRQAAVAARRAVRRVHRVQRLSEVQVRKAGAAGGSLSEVRRRGCGAQDQAGRYVLWVRELSQVRFFQQPEDDQPGLSEVR